MRLGFTAFYKDNKSEIKFLDISEERVKEYLEDKNYQDFRFPALADFENDLLENEYTDDLSITNIYKDYINDGYSIIRYSSLFNIKNKEAFPTKDRHLTAIIGNNVTKKDADIMYDDFKNLEKTANNLLTDFYSTYNDPELGPIYDYYEECYCNHKSSDVFKKYLDYKTNRLTTEDKEMFYKYRNFDLEELLTKDNEKYLVNNVNAGVIVITEDETFKRTNRRVQHMEEMDNIYKCIHPDIDVMNSSLQELPSKTGDILIQVMNGALVIWMREDINEYQQDELKKIVEEVKAINPEMRMEDSLNYKDIYVTDVEETLNKYYSKENIHHI